MNDAATSAQVVFDAVTHGLEDALAQSHFDVPNRDVVAALPARNREHGIASLGDETADDPVEQACADTGRAAACLADLDHRPDRAPDDLLDFVQ